MFENILGNSQLKTICAELLYYLPSLNDELSRNGIIDALERETTIQEGSIRHGAGLEPLQIIDDILNKCSSDNFDYLFNKLLRVKDGDSDKFKELDEFLKVVNDLIELENIFSQIMNDKLNLPCWYNYNRSIKSQKCTFLKVVYHLAGFPQKINGTYPLVEFIKNCLTNIEKLPDRRKTSDITQALIKTKHTVSEEDLNDIDRYLIDTETQSSQTDLLIYFEIDDLRDKRSKKRTGKITIYTYESGKRFLNKGGLPIISSNILQDFREKTIPTIEKLAADCDAENKPLKMIHFFLKEEMILSLEMDQWEFKTPLGIESYLGKEHDVVVRLLRKHDQQKIYKNSLIKRWSENIKPFLVEDKEQMYNQLKTSNYQKVNVVIFPDPLDSERDIDSFKKMLGVPIPIAIWLRKSPISIDLYNELIVKNEVQDTSKLLTVIKDYRLTNKDFGSHISLLWEDPAHTIINDSIAITPQPSNSLRTS